MMGRDTGWLRVLRFYAEGNVVGGGLCVQCDVVGGEILFRMF
jgi:hypothetical protein